MATYILTRSQSTPDGTLGYISDADGNHICFTCELPWDDNNPQTSCIPKDTYQCIPHNSPAHPNTWEVSDVPGRSSILIHNGNAAKEDSLGCILVGDSTGVVDGYPAVLNSVKTLEYLRTILPDNFTLVIS